MYTTKRFSIVLIGLLIGMLVIGGSGIIGSNLVAYAESSDNTEVYWGASSGCWVELSTHNDLYMGDATTIDPNGTINSEDTGEGLKKVEVETNCSYDLTVEATQFDLPDNHNLVDDPNSAITDFAVRADKTGKGSSNISSYTDFSDLNDPITIKEDGSSNGTTIYFMDYEYSWDDTDVPGSYRVHLTYTASTD